MSRLEPPAFEESDGKVVSFLKHEIDTLSGEGARGQEGAVRYGDREMVVLLHSNTEYAGTNTEYAGTNTEYAGTNIAMVDFDTNDGDSRFTRFTAIDHYMNMNSTTVSVSADDAIPPSFVAFVNTPALTGAGIILVSVSVGGDVEELTVAMKLQSRADPRCVEGRYSIGLLPCPQWREHGVLCSVAYSPVCCAVSLTC
ncbi:hypothetical protein BaRGS_00031464, partial [Batillaria attramentaria]